MPLTKQPGVAGLYPAEGGERTGGGVGGGGMRGERACERGEKPGGGGGFLSPRVRYAAHAAVRSTATAADAAERCHAWRGGGGTPPTGPGQAHRRLKEPGERRRATGRRAGGRGRSTRATTPLPHPERTREGRGEGGSPPTAKPMKKSGAKRSGTVRRSRSTGRSPHTAVRRDAAHYLATLRERSERRCVLAPQQRAVEFGGAVLQGVRLERSGRRSSACERSEQAMRVRYGGAVASGMTCLTWCGATFFKSAIAHGWCAWAAVSS